MKILKKTKDNIEATLQCNLISSILLSSIILNKMNFQGRIINVTSVLHKMGKIDFNLLENDMDFERQSSDYNRFSAYSLSKLGQIYFAKSLAEFCKFNKIEVKNFSVHPGIVLTNIWSTSDKLIFFLCILIYPFVWYFMKSQCVGAQSILYLCYDNYVNLNDGSYYGDCCEEISSKQSYDEAKNQKFIYYCLRLIEKNIKEKEIIAKNEYFDFIKKKV